MRQYRLMFESPPTDGPDNFDQAQEYFARLLGQNEIFHEGMHFRINLVDVQQLPRAGGTEIAQRTPAEERARHDPSCPHAYSGGHDAPCSCGADEPSHGLLPPAGVTHPWDQGAWIFPDDHPFSPLERSLKAHHDRNTEDPQYQHRVREITQEILVGETLEGEVVTDPQDEDE